MSWLTKIIPQLRSDSEKKELPEGIWHKCTSCGSVLYLPDLVENHMVCGSCDHHMRLNARQRIDSFLDQENRAELFLDIKPKDLLKFKDTKSYKERLIAAQKKNQGK